MTTDEEQGFTLIELMVVVLIIAILIAIAIPTFLGARQRAQDRAAQSDLRNGLTAEKTFYTDSQTYATSAQMTASNIETSLKWGTGPAVTLERRHVGRVPARGVEVGHHLLADGHLGRQCRRDVLRQDCVCDASGQRYRHSGLLHHQLVIEHL